MTTHSWIIMLIIPVVLVILGFARFGYRQDRRALAVPAKPGAMSALPIVALVLAILLPLVGVILAHVSLYRIALGLSTGRRIADAALVVGYALIAVEVLLLLIFYPGFGGIR